MNKIIKSLRTKIQEKRNVAKTIRDLNNLSDRNLEDMGLSPILVRQGKKGYPWK